MGVCRRLLTADVSGSCLDRAEAVVIRENASDNVQGKHHQGYATEGLYGAREGADNAEALFMIEKMENHLQKLEISLKGVGVRKKERRKQLNLNMSFEAVAKHAGKYF